MHEILHIMSERKKNRLCLVIHITTYTHDAILNIIACLDINVHEATNPVIEGTPIWVFNLV